MSKTPQLLVMTIIALSATSCGVSTPGDETAANADPKPQPSVLALMVTEVAPATDTLWGVEDPQSDQDWQVLSDAADRTIVAFEAIKQGGSGPNDKAWAAEAKWRAYSDDVIAAARSAKLAIAAQDMDALYDANDALYPPCEACHLDYHPGVIEPHQE